VQAAGVVKKALALKAEVAAAPTPCTCHSYVVPGVRVVIGWKVLRTERVVHVVEFKTR
jgi:hypothetical protein